MNYRRTSLAASCLFHGLLLGLFYIVGSVYSQETKPVVIDFSVLTGAGKEVEPGPAPPGTPAPEKPGIHRSAQTAAPMTHPPQPAPAAKERPASVPPQPAVEAAGPVALPVQSKPAPAVAAHNRGDGPPVSAAPPGGVGSQKHSGMFPGGGGGPGAGNGGGGNSGSSSGGGGLSAEQLRAGYLKEHFAYIRDLIQRNISYPARARKMGWAGKVVVSFIVHENGRVSDERVLHGSGFDLLDSNVITTIRQVAPFPRPPVTAELRVPIVYRLE